MALLSISNHLREKRAQFKNPIAPWGWMDLIWDSMLYLIKINAGSYVSESVQRLFLNIRSEIFNLSYLPAAINYAS